MVATLPCYDRAAFVSYMDLNADGHVDAAEANAGKVVFDKIAQGKDTFSVADYQKFVADPARVAEAQKLAHAANSEYNQTGRAFVATAVNTELLHLYSLADHRLSSRAKVLDELMKVVAADTPATQSEDFVGRLAAVIPGEFLSDYQESARRLSQYLNIHTDDYRARVFYDESRCQNAEVPIEDTAAHKDKAHAQRGKQAAQEWLDALSDWERVVQKHPMPSDVDQFRQDREEVKRDLKEFSAL